ncbi:MAG TPA: DegT/DnrJ/EryC1/StrS aminotransferase family protein [Opitutaceae bacterium]|nr:DegT/DnrJ/EryC1/StrS aminotransferase family protein [Opitutaceae bacterium]
MPLFIRPDYLPFGRPNFTEEEIDAVARVMRSGWVGMGPETMAFEKDLAAYLGAAEVVTVSSCTAALHLSLLVSGVRPGDEVICPSLTWCSTANAVLYAGARPVFCDVDSSHFCATPAAICARLTPRTKAVIVVHFGGYAADVDAVRSALPDGIAVIEDAAHALGSHLPSGARIGSSGRPTCFSFYANKNLSTAEGGAIALADPIAAARLRSLRQHALPIDAWKRFTHAGTLLLSPDLTELGYKMNYTDLQAAIGRVQLRRLPALQEQRAAIGAIYAARLGGFAERWTPQAGLAEGGHARHLYCIALQPGHLPRPRSELLTALRERNIGATVHYAPLHQMPLYQQQEEDLPVTCELAARLLTLPISASMSVADAEYVMDHLCELTSR